MLGKHNDASPTGVNMDELALALGDIGRNRLQVALRILLDARLVRRNRAHRYLRVGNVSDGDVLSAPLARYDELAKRDREALQQMIDYAQTGRCRWHTILEHFGSGSEVEQCGTCDNCRNPPHVEPVEESAKHESEPADTARKNPDTPRAYARGQAVRVRRYGVGLVTFATTDQVAVLFPDGATRTFLTHFVKAAKPGPVAAG